MDFLDDHMNWNGRVCGSITLNGQGKLAFVIEEFSKLETEYDLKKNIELNFSHDGKPWTPTKNSLIYSRHFLGTERSQHPLSSSWNLTIHPISKLLQKYPESARQRHERVSVTTQKNLSFN